jgi:hypothetical protein
MSMEQGRTKVCLSNIDVHETISDNLNINIDINSANTQPFLDNTLNNKQNNEEIENLRKSIVDMINDITTFNMHDIMRPIKDSEEIITHVINVKPGAKPVKQKSRGIPHSFREEFKKTIHEMKEAGIVDSSSPWCSPVRLVKKPDGSIRVCVDFRKENNLTIKDAYPLPKIEDIFSKITKGKYYTSLDLASGYYNVRMDKDSQKYTAFATMGIFRIHKNGNGFMR